jgi:adenylylsulfate kinase
VTAPKQGPGFVVWFTGLPASGKSTLAREVRGLLLEREVHAVLMDSDDLRPVLTPSPTYSEAERDWFYGVISHLAAWLASSGVNVLIAATGHRRRYRDEARRQIQRFAEVYVCCDLAVCQVRDPKGIYRLAEEGRADSVPGMGVAYEPPEQPLVAVDTDRLEPTTAAYLVLSHLAIL